MKLKILSTYEEKQFFRRGKTMSSSIDIKDELLNKINNKTAVVAVIGLGYVGLPLAVEKAKAGFRTIGFDIQE